MKESRIGFGSPRDAAAPFHPCEPAGALMKPISSFLTTRCTSAPRGYGSASKMSTPNGCAHVLASLTILSPPGTAHREACAQVCYGNLDL